MAAARRRRRPATPLRRPHRRRKAEKMAKIHRIPPREGPRNRSRRPSRFLREKRPHRTPPRAFPEALRNPGRSLGGGTPATSDPAPSGGESSERRTWVTDYEDVWVEDSPAWDESVPVYGSVEVSICNICGADITGNTAAHGKQHMLAGEGSGHHSEAHEVVVGHDTVHHDATGHWERVESGGHWEQG